MVCNNDDNVNTEISGVVPCGSDTCTPVPCTASGCTCGCNPCNCGLSLAPYYNEVPGCQESHIKVCSNLSYTAVVTAGTAFNMPACGQSITVTFPGLQKLQVGSFLWNTTFGYLQVTAFDCVNETATLYNDCQPDNAAPGTRIPACTPFNVVDPPADPYDNCGEGVWLTADYATPALNGSITISVSSTAGLLLNQNVQVGHGVYLLTAIVTANSITIKNIGGAGVVPFQIIHALDAQGRCITPIAAYSTDACAETPTTPGALVICANGAVTTLQASALGQIPTCVDVAENLFEPQTYDLPQVTCTILTACLTLIAGTRTYTLVVDDSSIFAEGDVIVIEDPYTDAVLWVITHIADGTHITIHSIEAQTLNITCIDVGIAVCHAPCCDQLRYDLDQEIADRIDICAQDWSAAQKGQLDFSWDADQTTTLAPADPAWASATKTLEIENDTCDTMRMFLTVDYIVEGQINTTEFSWARTLLEPFTGQSTAAHPAAPAPPVQASMRTLHQDHTMGVGPGTPCDPYNHRFYQQWHHSEVVAIPPNTNFRFDAHLEFTYVNYTPGSHSCSTPGALGVATRALSITAANTLMHIMALAIKEA